jgi:hypothetical protein
MSRGLALTALSVLTVGCSSVGAATRGALSPEYLTDRLELQQSFAALEASATAEVEKIRTLVRNRNAESKDLGTGILIGALIPYIGTRTLVEVEAHTDDAPR